MKCDIFVFSCVFIALALGLICKGENLNLQPILQFASNAVTYKSYGPSGNHLITLAALSRIRRLHVCMYICIFHRMGAKCVAAVSSN